MQIQGPDQESREPRTGASIRKGTDEGLTSNIWASGRPLQAACPYSAVQFSSFPDTSSDVSLLIITLFVGVLLCQSIQFSKQAERRQALQCQLSGHPCLTHALFVSYSTSNPGEFSASSTQCSCRMNFLSGYRAIDLNACYLATYPSAESSDKALKHTAITGILNADARHTC